MKRKINILVMALLCAMAIGGCKSNTDEKKEPKEPEITEAAATPIATNQVVQQTEETETPNENEEEGQPDPQDTKEPKNQDENEQKQTKEPKNQDENEEKKTKEPDSNKESYKVVLKKGEVTSNGTFQVTYPQIKGWSNKKSMKYWNQVFAAANYGSKDDGVDAYTLKTTVMTQNNELLSVLMEGSIRYEGINETTSFAYTYNINMKTGESYRLKNSKANLSKIEDKLMNENYKIATKNQNVSMVAILDTLYLNNEKDDDVTRVKEALRECDYDENNKNPACYSYWKNGKVSLVFGVNKEIGGYTIFELN